MGAGRPVSRRALAARATAVLGTTWLAVLLLLLWELKYRDGESVFMPPMSTILRGFLASWFVADPSQLFVTDNFRTNALPSLLRLAQGWSLAAVIGVSAGLVLGMSRTAATFFSPLIRFGMSTPSTALLPVVIVVFGITSGMNVALITIGSTWSVLINTIDGVRGLDPTMINAARSLRLGRFAFFWRVLLPSASPQIFAGLRVSLGIALILMVVSELYAATSGLGHVIVLSKTIFRFVDMWSAIVFVGVLGLILNGAFGLVEARVLRWKLESGKGAAGA